MRNLVCIDHGDHQLELEPEFGLARWLSIDDETGDIYVAGTGLQIACYSYSRGDAKLAWRANLLHQAELCSIAVAPTAAITAFSYAPDLEALCIALSTGELLLLRPASLKQQQPGGQAALQDVGAVEGGIAAAEWSPDGEALAVLGCAGQLLVMNSGWELLAEGPVACNEPAFPQPTAPPEPAAELAGSLGLVPGEVGIAWRGDGKYFATSTRDARGTAPRVRIWDRESGELHALGEAAHGLSAALAWQPNCRHLYAAATQARTPSAAAEAASAPGFEAYEALGGGGEQEAEGQRGAQGQAPEVRHVGAWKRELRRQKAAAAGAAAAASNRMILYERNGLQHGGFDVSGGGAVEALCWSPDSEYLAVVLAASDSGGGGERRTLQLWHRSNWHWYLKMERRFACCQGLAVAWDQGGVGLGLHALTAEGGYTNARFARECCVSAAGTAAVVDGADVLLTPLRLALVPPPMSAAAVACPAPVACLALRDCSEDEALAVVLSDGSIAVVGSCEGDLWEESLEEQLEVAPWDQPGAPRLLPRVMRPLSATLQAAGVVVQQVAWVSLTSLLLTASSPQGGSSLVELDLFAGGEGAEVAIEVCALPAPGHVLRSVSCAQAPGAVLEVEGGGLWVYRPGGQLEPAPESLPCSCHLLAATPAAALAAAAAAPAALGLNERGQLFWGSSLVASEVTSFVVRHQGPGGPFLLLTSRNHSMTTLPLSALRSGGGGRLLPTGLAPPLEQQQMSQQRDIAVRATEEGALLVAAPAGGVSVVYQAPRGNLEEVRPRALVLPAVAAALDAGDFREAWALSTSNRLDLNVLVDYCWPRFLAQAGEFLRQVDLDQDGADLLACLAPGNIAGAGGLYAFALESCEVDSSHRQGNGVGGLAALHSGGIEFGSLRDANELADSGSGGAEAWAKDKVAAVCSAVRAAVHQLWGGSAGQRRRWLKTELTSFSKCDNLEAALLLVKQAKEEEMAAAAEVGAALPLSPAKGSPVGQAIASGAAAERPRLGGGISAEEGLRHLLLHAPEEAVYRAALGSYELELAYMVVTHSQRDPGEYLLELQRFAGIPSPPLRRHAIDLHLGRHASALRHLAAAGADHFPAALALARRHGLLRLLLSLTERAEDAAHRALVHAAYGEELESKGKHEDAAVAYLAAGEGERALRAYRLAGQWRPALALAARLGREPERVRAMAARQAADLADGQQQREAAAITLEYLEDVTGGVELLTAGGEWREAVRVAYARRRGDLIESCVAPAAAAAAARILETVTEDTARVAKYWARLRELRERRAALTAAVAAADEESELPVRGDRDGDTVDGSVVTDMSVYTDRTAFGGGMLGSGASGASASTLGGKRAAAKKKARTESRKSKGKVRQGSPEEEAQLARHVLSLAPLPALCLEAGQLAEALLLLGHEADAALLQRHLAKLISSQQEAVADIVANPPPGEGLQVSDAARREAGAAGGGAAVVALEAAAAGMAGGELQRRAAEGGAALKGVHWKWDILREAEVLYN